MNTDKEIASKLFCRPQETITDEDMFWITRTHVFHYEKLSCAIDDLKKEIFTVIEPTLEMICKILSSILKGKSHEN